MSATAASRCAYVASVIGNRSTIIRICDTVSVDTSGRSWQVIFFGTRSFSDGETRWRDRCRTLPSSTSNLSCTSAPSSFAFDRSRTPHIPSLSGGKHEYPETNREASREVGSGRRISPQFSYLVPVFDSLVVSLRDPRGSGVGTETIFALSLHQHRLLVHRDRNFEFSQKH